MGDNQISSRATHRGYRGKHRDSETRIGDRASFAVPAMSLGIACVGITAAAPAAFAGGFVEPQSVSVKPQQTMNQQVAKPAQAIPKQSQTVISASERGGTQQSIAQGIRVQQKQIPRMTPQSTATLPKATAPQRAAVQIDQQTRNDAQTVQVNRQLSQKEISGKDLVAGDSARGVRNDHAQRIGVGPCSVGVSKAGAKSEAASNESAIGVTAVAKLAMDYKNRIASHIAAPGASLAKSADCSCPPDRGAIQQKDAQRIAASARHAWKADGSTTNESAVAISGIGKSGIVWGVKGSISSTTAEQSVEQQRTSMQKRIIEQNRSTQVSAPVEKGTPIQKGTPILKGTPIEKGTTIQNVSRTVEKGTPIAQRNLITEKDIRATQETVNQHIANAAATVKANAAAAVNANASNLINAGLSIAGNVSASINSGNVPNVQGNCPVQQQVKQDPCQKPAPEKKPCASAPQGQLGVSINAQASLGVNLNLSV